ncbi:MAG: hypothetical protein ABSC06_18350 [Rhodopila sp.]|jgi:hypothetical protein
MDRVERDPARGQLFWWLYDEHDTILAKSRGKKIPWKTLLADVQLLGLTNADGRPIKDEEALRKTFGRVRALKRREAELKQQKPAEPTRPTNSPPPVAVRPWNPAPAIPAAPMTDPNGMDPFRLKILRRSGKRV